MFIDTQVRPQGEVLDAVAPSKMKLSAAIRIGARLRPQCRRRFYAHGGSCAIGAAYEALGITRYATDVDAWNRLLYLTGLHDGEIPHWEITSRNDRGESRESIADWLEAQGL